ncbi:MAG: BatA domain-containing protein, partial [Clostridia bacterium]|nr:BatA domain-containing protein [Clostridia bacterium]
MAFLHPEALWLALTLPAIVFFYLLRPRRRERPV